MEFRILGPMDVLHEDRALPLGGPKQRALLAMLLMSANRVVSIDRLIDDLWGDDPPATAENILQVYVSQLRKVFRGATPGVHELLVTQRPGYMLRVGLDDLDLGRFREQLMLVLYRSGRQGEALETYRQGMQILGEELGISPSPTLQYLHEAILRQDPSLQPALPAPMTVAPPELERSRDSQLAL